MLVRELLYFGFAFKADTNDTRESPAIRIAKDLLEEGARLSIYDPKVSVTQVQYDLGLSPADGEACWQQSADPVEACKGADAVLILTEWAQFSTLDWQAIASSMRRPAWLFDTRAVANTREAREAGLQVWTVGEG